MPGTETVSSVSVRRVCHVLHTLGRGGAQELIVTLAAVAAANGLHMSVIVLERDAGSPNANRLRAHGVEVHSLGLRGITDPRGPMRLRRALGLLNPEIVHSHGRHADVLAAVARSGVARVSTVHLVETRRPGWRGLIDLVAARARAAGGGLVIAVSQQQRDVYVAAHPFSADQVRVIHNGLLLAEAYTGPPRPMQTDTCVLLGAGLLRPDRGYTHLVAAAQMMRQRSAVLIAGDGPLRDELTVQAAKGTADVRLLGFQEDVPALMHAANVFVHPSLTDALPTAVIHALAHGVPVVASHVGGIPEIVTPDTGVLVPAGDEAALAAALDGLVADPARRAALGEAGRRRFAEHFTAQRWAGRLRSAYDEALSRQATSAPNG